MRKRSFIECALLVHHNEFKYVFKITYLLKFLTLLLLFLYYSIIVINYIIDIDILYTMIHLNTQTLVGTTPLSVNGRKIVLSVK